MKLTVIAHDRDLIVKTVIVKGKFKDVFLKALKEKEAFEEKGLKADIFINIDTKKAQPYLRIKPFLLECQKVDLYINNGGNNET